MGETGLPAAAPEGYVAALFDGYAARFENELVGNLHYRAPEILHALFAPHVALGTKLDIVDLGCGTGLGGAAFRSLARRLDGIDLSPRMIEQARARAIYQDLTVGELVAGLLARDPARYDPRARDRRAGLCRRSRAAVRRGSRARCVRAAGSCSRSSACPTTRATADRGSRCMTATAICTTAATCSPKRHGPASRSLRSRDTATRIDRGEPVASLAVLLKLT
ncbi:MAG: methyltransferase domain-containing protein [Pseudomonadota bacterium]